MKNCLFFMSAISLLYSCQGIDLSDIGNSSYKSVTFTIDGITEEYTSKATLADAKCTDLWVWEGDALLVHKVSTDADFDAPTVNLTYGSHDLTFLASASSSQTWEDGVWSCSKVVDDFCATMTVVVSASSGSSSQVQLSRRSSRVKFVTTDVVPSTVSKCHIKMGSHSSLDALLAGGGAFDFDNTADISSKQGKTLSLQVNVLTASASEEEDCTVQIEFLDASGKVLYSYDRTVKLKANRCVTLTGAYFSGGAFSVSIGSTDYDDVSQEL